MNLRQTAALWTGRLSERLPTAVNRNLWRTLRLAKAQPIHRLTGLTRHGTPGSMIVSGIGPITAYLPQLFFQDEPREQHLATVPIFQLPRKLRELRQDSDLTALRIDQILARALFGSEYLRVPEWVRSSMPVPSTSQRLDQNRSLRQDLRLVRLHQFKSVESRSEADLKLFYETMFRPHTVGRHRSTTYLKSFQEVREFWKKGCLIWVEQAGERVAGMVVSKRKDVLVFVALGTRQGDEALLRKGVLSAAYQFSFEYAQRHGYAFIDFGATRPSVRDGLLGYKRKWGAILDPRTANPALFLVHWPTTNPSITAMLKANPLIFKTSEGLCCVHGDESEALSPDLTRGLNKAYLAKPNRPMVPLARQDRALPPSAAPIQPTVAA